MADTQPQRMMPGAGPFASLAAPYIFPAHMSAIKRTRFEVAPADRGWAVEREGMGLDSTHTTKEAAVQRGVQLARDRAPSELIIHRQDGSVQEVRNYGTDPKRLLKF